MRDDDEDDDDVGVGAWRIWVRRAAIDSPRKAIFSLSLPWRGCFLAEVPSLVSKAVAAAAHVVVVVIIVLQHRFVVGGDVDEELYAR